VENPKALAKLHGSRGDVGQKGVGVGKMEGARKARKWAKSSLMYVCCLHV